MFAINSERRVAMINKDKLKKYSEKYGVSLDDMALDRFDYLCQRLLRWNEHVNLTAITDPNEIVIKHFVDSLTLIPYANLPEGASVIDVGCGAGFPGLPIIIKRPDLNITFLDSVGKKLTFIKDALSNCGLLGDIVHARAEELSHQKQYRERFDLAVSRAVAPLNILAEYCLPFVKPGGYFIAMKGAQDEAELGTNAIKTLGGNIEQVVLLKLPNDDTRNLIIIKKISQTSSKYPRKSKKISTKPL